MYKDSQKTAGRHGKDASLAAATKFFGPLLVAAIALAAVSATLAPDGAGPGVTCDETYHVGRGKELITALRHEGLAFFQRDNIQRNFDWPPPVQGPLGYWILGGVHHLFDPLPDNPNSLSIPAARFAPALAFAMLVFLVGVWTARREGAAAGTVAATAVVLMPRMFAHSHLAALDMLTTLFFTAAILAATSAAHNGRTWRFAAAGAVWGATVLVRLHGLLAAPPIFLWMAWQLWRRARSDGSPAWFSMFKALAAWVATGAATVFLGWPWLWSDTVAHFWQYLASGAVRQSLNVFYMGRVWADRDVPWHYPWAMFVVTVPVGLLALGFWGIFGDRLRFRIRRDGDVAPAALDDCPSNGVSRDEGILVLGSAIFLLAVFSWPGVPVYDGERLFLMVFPLWAIWVGVGARRLCGQPALRGGAPHAAAARRSARMRWTFVGFVVASQGLGLVMYHPCQLSYYNLLVGGLAGAERLGFEATYWGDTIREPLLAEGASRSQGRPLLLSPNLATFQALGVEVCSPSLRRTGVRLVGEDDPAWKASGSDRYAVIYHRRADEASIPRYRRVIGEYKRQGVWLTRLVELDP